MTYKEIMKRLTQCETKLKNLQEPNNPARNSKNYEVAVKKLNVLKESLEKKLSEMDMNSNKGMVHTDDENTAKKLSDKGVNVKLTKEQDGVKFSVQETGAIAKKVGKSVAMALKTVGDEVASMKARDIEENSFEIHVEYKKDTVTDDFSFYISDDSLHLVDFSFDKELVDVGVKPSGEAIVNVDVLANELVKHFKSANEGMSDKEYADAKEKERLEKHPEKDKIKAIQNFVSGKTNALEEEPDEMKHPGYSRSSNQYAGRARSARPSAEEKARRAKEHQAFLDRLRKKNKELGLDEEEVNEAPANMYYIKVKKTDKASLNGLQDVIETWYSPVKFADIVDDDGAGNVIFYIKKEDWDPGMEDDIMGNGVQIVDTNIPLSEGEKEEDGADTDYAKRRREEDDYYQDPDYYKENKAEDTGGDLDVGHQDDEPGMLKSTAYESATYAAKLYKKLAKYDQFDGEVDFPNWWQSKLILAKDYLSKAFHYLDSEEKQPMIDKLALEGIVKEEDRDNPYTDYRDNSDGTWDAPKDYVHNIWRHVGVFGLDASTKKKNQAELIDAIEKFGYKYEVWKNQDRDLDIYYYVDGRTRPKKEDAEKISQIMRKHLEQERADFQARRKSSKKVKPQKLSKLTKGGTTYKVGEDDPKDDGKITSIEKYPNGYFINGVVYGDDDGDEYEKEGYGYAIDLDGNQMPEEDLEGMFEGKYKSDAQRKAIHAKKAELNEASYDEAIDELRYIVDKAEELGDEARQVVRQFFPDELSRLDGYGAFNFVYSTNRYDVTLGKFVDRLEEEGYEELDEAFDNNLNYDQIIGPIVKRFVDLKNYVQDKEPDAMDDLQKVMRAFEIFDEKMSYGTHMELEEGQAAIKKQLDKIDQALKQHKDTTIAIARKDSKDRTEDEKAHLSKMATLTKKKKELLDKYGDAVAGINRNQELDEVEAKPIPDSILRGYNINVKNAQSMAQAMISIFNQINDKESMDFRNHSGFKRVLAVLDKLASTKDTETPDSEETQDAPNA